MDQDKEVKSVGQLGQGKVIKVTREEWVAKFMPADQMLLMTAFHSGMKWVASLDVDEEAVAETGDAHERLGKPKEVVVALFAHKSMADLVRGIGGALKWTKLDEEVMGVLMLELGKDMLEEVEGMSLETVLERVFGQGGSDGKK